MVCGRAEIHERGVDHVAVELGQRAIVETADVLRKLGLPMQVAAHNVQSLAADGDAMRQ